MQIFVVIATRDREDLLSRTLRSLAQCRLPVGFAGTLVVENGCRGDAEHVVQEAAAILGARYLFEPIGNKCRALNLALTQVNDSLVVFLDDDVRLASGVLESYASAAGGTGPGHFFGGPVEAEYEDAPPEWLREFLPLSARGWRPADLAQVAAKPFFLGFNWAAFAGDLRHAGGFNERLGPGSETGVGDESEIQRHMVAAGVRAMYVPEALVHHWVPRARCSPEWTLDRAYRNGVRRGLSKADDAPGPIVAGYPLPLVKRAARSWLRAHVRGLRGQPGEHFAAQVQYRRQRGVLRGVMLGRRDGAAAARSTRHDSAAEPAPAPGDDR